MIQSKIYAQENIPKDDLHHCFFDEKSISLGIASDIILGEFWKNPGANFRAYYNIMEHFCFGPEIYWHQFNENQREWEVNLIAHYVIETPIIGIYPLAGASFLREQGEHQEDFYGIVAGIGLHRNLKRFTLFTEYSKGIYVGANSDKVTAGLLYTLKIN